MSERVRIGGKRRIDRILDPAFLQGLSDLDVPELRRRRDECRAELEYVSYFRRLLQARADILRAERDRRSEGSDVPVVDRLGEILADDRPHTSRGGFVNVVLPEADAARARRYVERLVSDAALSDLAGLDDARLGEAIDALEQEERAVSDDRRAVIAAHDTIQEELKRRYKADLSQVT